MTLLLPLLRSSSARVTSGGVPASSLLRLGGVRHGSITMWNQDWRPGPYPTTPEQRAAAAKKYGLLPEDYEPMDPNKAIAFGDYPKIPEVGMAAKDPYYDYDDQEFRRNFGEPVHMDWDCYTEDRFEPQSKVKGYWPEGLTYRSMRIRGFLVIFTILTFYYSTCNVVADYPILPKQWPADVTCKGMKHYTFEIDDEC